MFVAVCRLSPAAVSRSTLHCGAQASHHSGFSCCRPQVPGTRASVVAALGLGGRGGWA